MDLDLYDEFGNYIGPDIDDEEEIEEQEEQQLTQMVTNETAQIISNEPEEEVLNQIVLHEDKKYYPSAEEVYGEDVDAVVELEDQQPLTEPIIKPIKQAQKFIAEKDLPTTNYRKEYLVDLLKFPELTRMISVVGHLHHGKTSFVDMIINHTHQMDWDIEKSIRYTDVHFLERERGISIKAMPISVLMESLKTKNYFMNFMDTPGHCNFSDEISCSTRISDGAILLVDAIEGVSKTGIIHSIRKRFCNYQCTTNQH